MNNDRTLKFNKVFVLDCLPNNPKSTAKELYDDCLVHYKSKEIDVQLIKIASKEQLLDLLDEICYDVKYGIYPILHFECHGSIKLIQIGENVFIYWYELQQYLININKATGNNLIITMAACFGIHLIETVDANECAPFSILIGPDNSIDERLLLKCFMEFYTRFFHNSKLFQGYNNSNTILSESNCKVRFQIFSSEIFFYNVFCKYINESCNPSSIKRRYNESKNSIEAKRFRRANPNTNRRKHFSQFINSKEEAFNMLKINFLLDQANTISYSDFIAWYFNNKND